MYQNLFLWLSPPDSYQRCRQHDIRCLTALYRPANDAAGIEIDDDRQIGETFVGTDVGDVGDPGLVWSFDVELPIQRVVDDNGRSATIDAGTALVSDLSFDTGNPGQAGNPIRAACLAVIEQAAWSLCRIAILLTGHRRKLLLPLVKRMLADTQPL
jgi:hypothetical protein